MRPRCYKKQPSEAYVSFGFWIFFLQKNCILKLFCIFAKKYEKALFFCFCMLSVVAMCQDKMGYMSLLYETFVYDTAIVRNYQPNISVVYTGPFEDAPGDRYFHIVNTATNRVR